MHLDSPNTHAEFKQSFELRWRILVKPGNEPDGSERDPDEASA